MTKRVVVTGAGIISPVGNSVDTFWDNLIAGFGGHNGCVAFRKYNDNK
ncbi:MAG: hypothetical protein IKB37_01400 [Rikenellaceae bacterium]|nr:hypothetical protein [Rikenellaceae bacterium]